MSGRDVAGDCAAAMHGACPGSVPSWDTPAGEHACQCPCHALQQAEGALPIPRQLADSPGWDVAPHQ